MSIGVEESKEVREKWNTLPSNIKRVISIHSEEWNVRTYDVLGGSRFAPVVTARTAICHTLRSMGITLPLIGFYLNLHHTSVHAALEKPKPDRDRPAKESMSPAHVEAAVWQAWVRRFGAFTVKEITGWNENPKP